MSNEKKLVPALRFPEFENSNNWDYANGNILFDSVTNKKHNSELPILAITQEHGAIPRDKIDYNVSVTETSVENYKVVEIGDFIISLRSFQGGIEYSTYRGICSPAYIVLQKKRNIVDKFFKYYFKNHAFINTLNRNIEGIRDGKMISYQQFSEIILPIPPIAEQQKIADCLSSLDDLIEAQTKKLDALKEHKKGLMQQLFPAEGETAPKLRFKEFAGEWELKPLGDLSEIITGNTPSTVEVANYGGDKLFVSPADIAEARFVTDTKARLSDEGYSKTRHVKAKSVLFVCIGSTIGKVAQNKFDCATNQQINSLVVKDGYSSDFLFSILESKARKIAKIAGIQAVPIINKSTFASIEIPFPNFIEQQKIADCLFSLDELIDATKQKINSLKLHKKGLMQQLFPATD